MHATNNRNRHSMCTIMVSNRNLNDVKYTTQAVVCIYIYVEDIIYYMVEKRRVFLNFRAFLSKP